MGMFLQASTFTESEMRQNDIRALLECLKTENISQLIKSHSLSHFDTHLLRFLEKNILGEMALDEKGGKLIKLLLNRMHCYMFSHKDLMMYLINQNLIECNYQAAYNLCSLALDRDKQQKYGSLVE